MVENTPDYGLFEPDVNFVVFNNRDDLLEKVKYYISHEKERKEFAKNAYKHLKTIPYTNSLAGPMCTVLNYIIGKKKRECK